MLGESQGRIERLGQAERLRSLGELEAAALVLAQAARVLLDETIADPRIRLEVFAELARTELEQAVTTVERVVTVPAERLSEVLDRRYRAFAASCPRCRAWSASRHDQVRPGARRHPPSGCGGAGGGRHGRGAPGSGLVVLAEPKADLIDGRAYTMCTLEALRHAIRRRDVFVPAARRWGRSPTAAARQGDLASQPGPGPAIPPSHRWCSSASRPAASELDAAYHRAAAVVTEQPELLVFDHDVGRQRFKIPPLDALAVPESTTALRECLAARLPAAELPEVMLEVDAWTGFTAPMTDMVTGGGTRASDLAVSVWNSGYMDHAVEHLQSEGTTIADEDLEHLSPPSSTSRSTSTAAMSSLLRSTSARADCVPSPLRVVVSANPARLLPGGRAGRARSCVLHPVGRKVRWRAVRALAAPAVPRSTAQLSSAERSPSRATRARMARSRNSAGIVALAAVEQPLDVGGRNATGGRPCPASPRPVAPATRGRWR